MLKELLAAEERQLRPQGVLLYDPPARAAGRRWSRQASTAACAPCDA
jgi:hypothetical protein